MAGKVVLISGTAQGQGRAAALRFAAEGACVVGGDIQEAAALETQELVRRAGSEPGLSQRLDVTDEVSVRAWVDSAVQTFGRIDVLYNNAGAVRFGPLTEQPFSDWRLTLSAELDSVFLCTRAAWPHLLESRGCVINVGSTAGMSGSMHVGRVAHTASKAGVIAVTKQMAAEGARHGIRVNCISPGLIDSEGARESLLRPESPTARLHQHVPMGRAGSVDEVVNVAVFLAGPQASYVTGANVVVDGGWSAVLPGPVPEEQP